MQGYNAQAVTTMHQLVVAAALTDEANDVHQLDPMLKATAATLAAAGIDERPEAALADSGYWSIDNLTTIPNAPDLYIPPARHGRQGKPRKDGKPSESRSDGLRTAMTAKLKSEDGKARYAKRRETVEPVFGQLKQHQGARRFLRRGRRACQAEWKLLCGTHNLLTSPTTCPRRSGRWSSGACAPPGPTPTLTRPRPSWSSWPAALTASDPVSPPPLHEGLEQTLTVTRLGVGGKLLQTVEWTNPIESMTQIVRDHAGRVKRWSSGEIALRWAAARMLAAEGQFRWVKGYQDLPQLALALERTTAEEPGLLDLPSAVAG